RPHRGPRAAYDAALLGRHRRPRRRGRGGRMNRVRGGTVGPGTNAPEPTGVATMSSHPSTPSPRPGWAWVRLLAGAAVLALVVVRIGAGPFLDGVRLTTTWSLA